MLERIAQLCKMVADEKDPDKVLALVQELNDLLEDQGKTRSEKADAATAGRQD